MNKAEFKISIFSKILSKKMSCSVQGNPQKDLAVSNLAAKNIVADTLSVCTRINAGSIVVPTDVPGTNVIIDANGVSVVTGGTVVGTIGPQGIQGVIGPGGLVGPAGPVGTLGYAFIYNLTGQSIAIEADIPFSNTGLLTTGFTHTPGSPSITIVAAGIYQATFSVSGAEPNQFAFFLNGALIPGSIYGSGAGTQQNTGLVIFSAGAGDVLTVRNHSSAAAVTLASVVGGTQANSNASVTILKIA